MPSQVFIPPEKPIPRLWYGTVERGILLGQHAGVQDIFIFSPFGNGKEVDAVEKEATYCAQVRTDSISSQVRNKPTCHCVCVLVFPLFSCNSPPRAPVCTVWSTALQCTHTEHGCLFCNVLLTHKQAYTHRQRAMSLPPLSLTHTHTANTTEGGLEAECSPTTHCKLKINQRWAWSALMCICVHHRHKQREK